MPPAPHRSSLADRLLAELVRMREETAGHPQDCAAADAAAVRAGGDLAQRIRQRARALPGSDALHRAIRRLLGAGTTLIAALLLLAAISGFAAAAAALDATTPASLPLVLLVVVGMNLLMLLLWLLAQVFGARVATGLAAALRTLWQRYAHRLSGHEPGADEAARELLRLLGSGAVGRWLAASIVHAAWLAFALAAVLALTVLLSVRAYELSWATTLLGDDALAAWARLLSTGPALLGIPGAERLSVTEIASAQARQSWSVWLLAAAFVYGVLPRALALGISLLLLLRAQASLGRDLQRPGFARLRTRLMPDHASLGTIDAAPAPPQVPPAVAMPATPQPLRGRVHGLALESGADTGPPVLTDIEWIWLGAVDDAASRDAVLQRLRSEPVAALAVLVRATLTPDRGIERYVGELVAAAGAPTQLLLVDIAKLEARGEHNRRQRLADWSALAQRAGASGGALPLHTPMTGRAAHAT